ncbi:nucleoside hydrolase [Cohnella pontilimi]|uniref:Nucleoside hydrolase n=1 Tax=Cohnella pontilimi TaxID=2564100 RepID=A0A4U0FBR9_9BACL|nr:nucleoside hydrolase [Cohnella pontilimi]TJY42151.1 nucleoside hydrolase [Cohnella pontilimi]
MTRMILDTDIATDVDDAMALALAMRSTELDLVGVTTVYGDVKLRARLAKKLLHLGGRPEVPVFAGIEKPLLHNREIWWPGHEGDGVLGDEEIPFEEGHAVDYLIDTVMKSPGQITIVPIGPLTNIAAAIIREPRVAQNVKEIVLMGGVTRLGDNGAELPHIEHNIKSDPEAAHLVFTSGAPIVMVGLDVTMKVKIRREEVRMLESSGDPLNAALAKLIERWLDVIGQDWTAMHDPLAVSLLIDRSLVQTKKMTVKIDYDHREPSGQTVAWADPAGRVDVCLDVEASRFVKMLMERLIR